ncbi:MAG: hypothetical protein ACSHW7_07985 [Patiriisocius sp.]|uniref:hypothetical protein n=1 Tax=Patiriisocius sp. TaxID=2822396 RepID=UPI003EF53B17
MKYTTHGTTGNHKILIRNRETIFDTSTQSKSTFGSFENHTEMKTWEFAAFQKEQFAKKKKERKRFWLLLLVSTIAALIAFFLAPLIMDSLMKAGGVKFPKF